MWVKLKKRKKYYFTDIMKPKNLPIISQLRLKTNKLLLLFNLSMGTEPIFAINHIFTAYNIQRILDALKQDIKHKFAQTQNHNNITVFTLLLHDSFHEFNQ